MRRSRLAACIASAATAALSVTASACNWPVPSCDEGHLSGSLRFEDDELDLLDDGRIRARGETYASCNEVCAAQPGVVSVISCKPPHQPFRGPNDAGAGAWLLSCTVEATSCRLPTIISFGSGRRPEGYVEEAASSTSIRAWLAEAGRLEAASAPAFDRLARELSKHKAPATLVRRARRAMRDEIQHARVVSELARSYGARVRRARIKELKERALEAIALENAVEGCVHETLGAMLATFQARRARDPDVRAVYARIAREETRHAELAWNVLSWSLGQLKEPARSRVREALVAAAARVTSGAIAARSPGQASVLGLPNVAEAEQLIAKARELVWQPIYRTHERDRAGRRRDLRESNATSGRTTQ